MKRIFFIFSVISLISVFPAFSQESSDAQSNSENQHGSESGEAFAIIPELEAEETSDISGRRTRAIFKTNVKNCSVFLNGNLQGRTLLTLNNLVEGYYLLRVEKDGYEFVENFVYIESGKSKSFYVELEPNEETKKREEAQANARANAQNSASQDENAQSNENAAATNENSAQPAKSAAFGDAK